MLNYIEYLNMPTIVAIALVVVFLIIQLIGEILEFKGKVVPEFIKIRKYFKRKKEERKALIQLPMLLNEYQQMTDTIKKTNQLLADFDKHYSKDNIAIRNKWMEDVNSHILNSEKTREKQEALMRELNEKLDKNNEATLSLLVEDKRDTIINFASNVVDERFPVTREQFNRVFKAFKDYEEIIEEHKIQNGEVSIAIRIIEESYEKHMKDHTFIENVRGYNV